MYSHIIDGKVFDFNYTGSHATGMYTFRLVRRDKHVRLGTVHNIGRTWTAVTVKGKMDGFGGRVDGFGSRTDAALYLVSHFDNERGIKRE